VLEFKSGIFLAGFTSESACFRDDWDGTLGWAFRSLVDGRAGRYLQKLGEIDEMEEEKRTYLLFQYFVFIKIPGSRQLYNPGNLPPGGVAVPVPVTCTSNESHC
jgi:hypothetical protein